MLDQNLAQVGLENLFAAAEGIAHPLGGEECLFTVTRSGEVHAMTVQVLEALSQCRPFRTLEEHVAQVQKSNPKLAGQYQAVVRVVENWRDRGLLISAQSVLAELPDSATTENASFTLVLRIGSNIEASLQQLEFVQSQAAVEDISFEVVAIAESLDKTQGEALKARLVQLCGVNGIHANVFDLAALQAFCKNLAGVAADASQVLAHGLVSTIAARRNAAVWNIAQLLAGSARYIYLEESTKLDVRGDGNLPTALAQRAVNQLGAFPTQIEAHNAGPKFEGGFLARHLGFCGQGMLKSLADNAAASLHNIDLLESRLLRDAQKIVLTTVGTRGSSAALEPTWMYSLGQQAIRILGNSRESYDSAMAERACIVCPANPTVSEAPTSHLLAMDGAAWLPPMVSAGLRKTELIAALLPAVDPGALVLNDNLSVAVNSANLPANQAKAIAATESEEGLFLADVVAARSVHLQAQSPHHRAQALAAGLRDLANASEAVRLQTLHEFLRYQRTKLILDLQDALQGWPAAPVYWGVDQRKLVEVNAKASLQERVPRLSEWSDQLNLQQTATELSNLLNDQASLLEQWHQAREWARDNAAKVLEAQRIC